MGKQKKGKKKKPKVKSGKIKIPLTCGYCGEDLQVYIKGNGTSRGRIYVKEGHGLILRIKCRSCGNYQQFERTSRGISKWGWQRIDLPFEPSAMRQAIDEQDRVRLTDNKS